MLSEREITVLGLLPSMLSLEEIALDLTVSVNTVKSHVRSIYTKLGVSSRRLAVLAAHERGLLSPSTDPAPAECDVPPQRPCVDPCHRRRDEPSSVTGDCNGRSQ